MFLGTPIPTRTYSGAAFDGFGDDESGFYETYSRAFGKVWEAERDWGEVSSDAGSTSHNNNGRWGQGDAPEMGGSTASYETAEAFYFGWSGFVSRLSFGWVDEYNVNEVRHQVDERTP